MLDFIWHLRGSVVLDGGETNEAVLDRVERLLDTQRKTFADRGPDYVTFDDPLWSNPFGPSWVAMVIYDRGRFWIERSLEGRLLRYDLRSLHGFVWCLFGSLTFFLLGLFGNGSVSDGLKFATFAFGWLYGGNLALAFLRVPSAIRNAVRNPL